MDLLQIAARIRIEKHVMNGKSSDDREEIEEALRRIGRHCATREAVNDFTDLEHQVIKLLDEREFLDKAVHEDALTGVGNRRGFELELRRAFAAAVRYQQPLALILVDVNRFKEINDRWGHVAGDQVLRRVARIMHDGLRSADYVARYGGDEFVAILPSTDQAGADQLAVRLQYELNQPISWIHSPASAPTAIDVSVGLGTASLQETDQTEWDLFQRSDESLIRVKRGARQR